jgi:hypothetical protein
LLAWAGVAFWVRQVRQTRHRRTRYARYSRRESLLLPQERDMYEALQRVAGDRVRVLAKVRLGDLVTVEGETESPQRQAHWRSAQRRGVDFVLCGAADYMPLLAIQMEGKKDRTRRHARGDTVLEDVLSSADIRLAVLDPAESTDPVHLGIRVRAALESAREYSTERGARESNDEMSHAEQPGLLRRLLGVFTADVQDLLRRPSELWGLVRNR